MTNYQPDSIFNLIIKLAVVVCLGTLALSLTTGVDPLSALLRSGTAFGVFAILGWATSLVWTGPTTEIADQPVENTPADDTDQQPPVNKQIESDVAAEQAGEMALELSEGL